MTLLEIVAWNEFIDTEGYRALAEKGEMGPLYTKVPTPYLLAHWKAMWKLSTPDLPFSWDRCVDFNELIRTDIVRFFTDPVRMAVVRQDLRRLLREKKITHTRTTIYCVLTLLRLVGSAELEPLIAVIGKLCRAVRAQELALRELQARKMDGFVEWTEVVEMCESVVHEYENHYKALHMDKNRKYRCHHLGYLMANFLSLIPPMRHKPLSNAYIAQGKGNDHKGNYMYIRRGECNRPFYTLVIQDDKQCNLQNHISTTPVVYEMPLGDRLSAIVHESYKVFPRIYLFQQDLRSAEPVKHSFFDKLLLQCTGMKTNMIRASFSTYWRWHTDGKCDLAVLAQQMRTSVAALSASYLRTMDYYGRNKDISDDDE